MRPSARAGFVPLTDDFEGCLNHMYTDSIGLVTTGRGNLIDPGRARNAATDPQNGSSSARAKALPWQMPDGSLAGPVTVDAAFWDVKNAWPSVQSVACARLTSIRLSRAAVDSLTLSKLDQIWTQLVGRFPYLPTAPADAQLGHVSMAWAMGAGFQFPHFQAAAAQGDWNTCATECQMTRPPVPVRRNAANRRLFTNATLAADPDVLYYPRDLAAEAAQGRLQV